MNKKLISAGISCLLMIVLMRIQGSSLKTAQTPGGILNLEFANSPAKLTDALSAWNATVVTNNIWLDFLFIPSYVLLLSLITAACAAKWGIKIVSGIGSILVRAAFAAGIFDIAENLLMMQSIAGNYTPNSLWLTYYCAGIKFMIVAIILFYILISIPVLLKKNKQNGA